MGMGMYMGMCMLTALRILYVMLMSIYGSIQAIEEYEEAVKRDPKNAAYYNNLAAAYLKMGLFNDAKRAVEKSLGRLAVTLITMHCAIFSAIIPLIYYFMCP